MITVTKFKKLNVLDDLISYVFKYAVGFSSTLASNILCVGPKTKAANAAPMRDESIDVC